MSFNIEDFVISEVKKSIVNFERLGQSPSVDDIVRLAIKECKNFCRCNI